MSAATVARRTKIVATLGPATDAPDMMRRVLAAGVDVVRLNLSHGERADHERRLALARETARAIGRHIGAMIDTRGPEVRIGGVPDEGIDLKDGQALDLLGDDASGNAATSGEVHVNHAKLADDVEVGDRVLVDDGRIVLEVRGVHGRTVHTEVAAGGRLLPGKKVQVPGRTLSLPDLPEADAEDIAWGARQGVEWVAASFVRSAATVVAVRRVIEAARGATLVMAKIETGAGLERLDEILAAADGVMVARGDLGVELPVEDVPGAQKRIIRAARRLGKPVVTATEMLESMVHAPRPTRAEASDVANAVWDGSDAVMLSAETAAGEHPDAAVATMDRICRTTEQGPDFQAYLRAAPAPDGPSVTEAVSRATVQVACDLKADAIVAGTQTGFTARMVSRHRPPMPIVAVTSNEMAARALSLVWGVEAIVARPAAEVAPWEGALDAAQDAGMVPAGGLAVVTGGSVAGAAGATDLLQVRHVARRLVSGRGIGRVQTVGMACRVADIEAASRDGTPCVLVARSGDDPGFVAALEHAQAAVVEQGGLTSTAAVAALSLHKPVVVGAEGACAHLASGSWVTVDALRGWVYEGRVRAPGHHDLAPAP